MSIQACRKAATDFSGKWGMICLQVRFRLFSRQSALLSLGASKESYFETYPVFEVFEEYLGVVLPLVLGADDGAEFTGDLLENGDRARQGAIPSPRGTPSSRLPPSTHDGSACGFARPGDAVGSMTRASS